MGSKTQNERLADIEATQASLRDSIEQSRQLAERSQQLIEKHREALSGERGREQEQPPES